MATLATLEAQVEKTVGIEQSALVLIQGLQAALAAAGSDPLKLQELQDRMAVSAQALADAVAANPAAPANPA